MAFDPVRTPWRVLGELLVARGLLTADELDRALAEQARTGRRLGEILVARGFVSGLELSRALAEQLGIEMSPREAVVVPFLPRRRRTPAFILDPAPCDDGAELGEALRRKARRRAEATRDRSVARSLLFLPRAEGYLLVERCGSPPALGEAVETPQGRFQVVKVGRSPLPADPRPCAFLQPL